MNGGHCQNRWLLIAEVCISNDDQLGFPILIFVSLTRFGLRPNVEQTVTALRFCVCTPHGLSSALRGIENKFLSSRVALAAPKVSIADPIFIDDADGNRNLT